MRIAREGYPFAAAGALLAGILWMGVYTVGSGAQDADPTPATLALEVAAWVASLLAMFVLWFFRDPEPSPPEDSTLVVAPGQGKVIGIEEIDEPTFMGGPATKISIFLSVFDVHVQRAPVTGVVEQRLYRPGAYAVAWADKASEDNEMASLGISSGHGPVLVRQIAGLVARRIITDPEEGSTVERAERFGLIRFGSRVDLFIPTHWEVLCREGDRVRVGTSVLARQLPEAV